MDEQTQKAFALGGEAETVDPVSGNDVPPGSLPEEVRDDIDAKLSEGEYVVPADVVRFFGVKFFENLRTKAKQDLQQMDEDGRIGGEPTSEMPLPFDVSELEVEDEDGMRMAIGGLISEYAVGGYTGIGSSFGGYGGYTGYKPYDPTAKPVTVTAPPPVATTTAAPANIGSQLKTYYDKMGNQVSVMFVNGKPQQSLQGLTTSNPNASGNSGPVNVNLGNDQIGTSAATTNTKGDAIYKPGSSALEVATTGIDQLAKNTESGLSLGRIVTAGIGFVANSFFPGSGLLVGSLFKSGSDATNYSNALVAEEILRRQSGKILGVNKAGRNTYENPTIAKEYEKMSSSIKSYNDKNQTMAEKIMKGILPSSITEKADAFFKEVPKIAGDNNVEPVKFGGTNWGGEQPEGYEANTYTTTPLEKTLGVTSVPRKEARGSDGQAVNKPASELNWNEVQQLRSHSSVANKNKLADWNDHVKNGTATSAGKDGNSGSGDSDRVICTELYKQGKLDRELYRMDVMYTARHLSDTTVRGYHYWAIPMVTRMRTSTFLTNVFKYLTVARAKEIAYIVKPEKHKKRSLLGYLIKNIGEAICFSIGLFVVQKDWTVLYKGNKQYGN